MCALALAGVAPLAGCSLLAPPAPPPRRALLGDLPAQVPQRAGAGDIVVLVALPQAHRAYDTTQMGYTLRAHEMAYYRDHEWAATPPQMLLPLLVSTLQRTRGFAAVLSAPAYAGRATHVLQTQLVELVQDFGAANGPQVRLVLQVQLVHTVSRRAASHEIAVSVPMAQRSSEAGVAAANRAAAQALREVAQFVLDTTR